MPLPCSLPAVDGPPSCTRPAPPAPQRRPARRLARTPHPRRTPALLVLAAGLALAGCGGGEPPAAGGPGPTAMQTPTPAAPGSPVASGAGAPPAAGARSDGSTRRQALGTNEPVAVTPEMLLDWAEWRYPELFPLAGSTLLPDTVYQGTTYQARAYGGAWGTRYLGITPDQRVWGLGDFTDQQLRGYDTVTTWAPQVRADRCQVWPAACASGLASRRWAEPQALFQASTAMPLDGRVAATIDDAGRVTVLARQHNGSRVALQATRGVPFSGPRGSLAWSAPVAIDVAGGVGLSNASTAGRFALSSAPAGDVWAWWRLVSPCRSDTYLTSGQCQYYYTARWNSAESRWEPPVLMADAPGENFTLHATDAGDAAVLGDAWVRDATGTFYTPARALYLKTAQDTQWRRVLLEGDPATTPWTLAVDSASGRLLLATRRLATGRQSIVAWRGTVAAGLDAQPTVLDAGTFPTNLLQARLGRNGVQLLVWAQGVGSTGQVALSAATSTSPTAPLTVAATGLDSRGSFRLATVTDAGEARVIDETSDGPWREAVWRAGQGWSPVRTLPPGLPAAQGWHLVHNRQGDLLLLDAREPSSPGATVGFDQARQQVVALSPPGAAAGAANPLGLAGPVAEPLGFGAAPLLAEHGLASVLLFNRYTQLPAGTRPGSFAAGVQRPWVVPLR